MASKELHASGDLRERALAWWSAQGFALRNVKSVLVKADGYIRFEWDDGKESGPFNVSFEQLYKS